MSGRDPSRDHRAAKLVEVDVQAERTSAGWDLTAQHDLTG
jgi:hypothetical protein